MPRQHLQVSACRSRHKHHFIGMSFEHMLYCRQVAPSSHHQQHAIAQLEQKHQRQLADLAQQLASHEEVVKAAEKRAEGSEAAHKKTQVCQPTEHWSVLHACEPLLPCCCVVHYNDW